MCNPLQRFSRATAQPLRFSPFANQPMASACAKHRLLLTHDQDTLALWRIGQSLQSIQESAQDAAAQGLPKTAKEPTAETLALEQAPEFVLEMRMRDGLHILSSAISRNGMWIAACDAARVHLYKITVSRSIKRSNQKAIIDNDFHVDPSNCRP
jgi:hypothetical protein